MKGKQDLKTEINLNQLDVEFLEIVKLDITSFLTKYKYLYFVLIFPPLNSFRRLLIHNFIGENFAGQGLETFSVGQDSRRRTVVCHISQLLNSSNVSDECGETGNKHSLDEMLKSEVMLNNTSNGIKCKAKATRNVSLYRPPAARTPEQKCEMREDSSGDQKESPKSIKETRKGRRPDRKMYVPRPLRSDHTSIRTSLVASAPVVQKSVTVEDLKITCYNGRIDSKQSQNQSPVVIPKEVDYNTVLSVLNVHDSENIKTNNSTPQSSNTKNSWNDTAKEKQGLCEDVTPDTKTHLKNPQMSLEDVKTKSHFLEYLDSIVASSPKNSRNIKDSVSITTNQETDYRRESDYCKITLKNVSDNKYAINDIVSPVTQKISEPNHSIVKCRKEPMDDFKHVELQSEDSFCSVSDTLSLERMEGPSVLSEELLDKPFNLKLSATNSASENSSQNGKNFKIDNDRIPLAKQKNTVEAIPSLSDCIEVKSNCPSSKLEIKDSCEHIISLDTCSKRKEVSDDEVHVETRIKHRHLSDVPHVLIISEPSSQPISPTSNKQQEEIDLKDTTQVKKSQNKQSETRKDTNPEAEISEHHKNEYTKLSFEECDNWEELLEDESQSFEPDLIDELGKSVGKVRIASASYDYSPFQTLEERTNSGECILEIYGFPPEFSTRDLLNAFAAYRNKAGFHIKWVDDTHALAVFNSPLVADEVLLCELPNVKTRPLRLGIPESRLKARNITLPPATRPKTCPALARRLVTGALGLKVRTDQKAREAEKLILKEARDQRRLAAKQKDAAWEGTIGSKL